MRLIAPNANEKKLWDELVSAHNGLIFSKSWYLDATGFDWMLCISDDFKGGMACPFVEKMGQRILVTPFFVRCVQWVGEPIELDILLTELQQKFQVADLQVIIPGLELVKKHQFITSENFHLGSQAKRSLKKAATFAIDFTFQPALLFDLVKQELQDRIHGINEVSMVKLRQIVEQASEDSILQLSCWDETEFKGGLWLLEDENRVIYLKGTSTAIGKKEGVMYRLMVEAIEYTLEKDKIFDFGGSNVESVSKFNYNFGAEDAFYSQLKWNTAPWWWNLIRNWRNKWKKK